MLSTVIASASSECNTSSEFHSVSKYYLGVLRRNFIPLNLSHLVVPVLESIDSGFFFPQVPAKYDPAEFNVDDLSMLHLKRGFAIGLGNCQQLSLEPESSSGKNIAMSAMVVDEDFRGMYLLALIVPANS